MSLGIGLIIVKMRRVVKCRRFREVFSSLPASLPAGVSILPSSVLRVMPNDKNLLLFLEKIVKCL